MTKPLQLSFAMLPILLLLFFSDSYRASSEQVSATVEFNFPYTGLNLLYLKIVGYDFEVIDVLENVMNGAVIKIDAAQVDNMEAEAIVSNLYREKSLKTHVQESLKIINAEPISALNLNGKELTGKGIRVAVVDTGIDYTHKDLFGFGSEGKVIGGYDFLEEDNEPLDTDGHGTQVAGIIAANGTLRGVAPGAQLVAYRIASEGSYVSTTDMIRALDRAVNDKIDVVNISLGLDYVTEEIDTAIEKLVNKGVIVVTAAGNNGEDPNRHIGSPASAPSAITVGASFNNITINRTTLSSVSTLKVDNNSTAKYSVLPMLGSIVSDKPVTGKLVFANYATENDFENIDVTDAIVLAERGGPIRTINGNEEREIVYFTDKERNVADSGGVGLIVYNNEGGSFQGTLINQIVPPGYKPTMPVVSLPREEGLLLKNLIENQEEPINAELKVFFKPNVVAPFSSRGPVSSFYLKPTLVAPGSLVNSTTLNNSYNVTSGTSFAAPHVTGAVALLLQKNHELKPSEVVSILATTAQPVSDAYDTPSPFDLGGAGLLDVNAALKTNLVVDPFSTILYLSPNQEASRRIEIKSTGGSLGELKVSKDWNHPVTLDIDLQPMSSQTANLVVKSKLSEPLTGKFEGRVNVKSRETKISIPVVVSAQKAGVAANNEEGRILLSIDTDQKWTFAKVKVMGEDNMRGYTVTLTPSNNLKTIPARILGENWIEANIATENGDLEVFSILEVNEVSSDGKLSDYFDLYDIPAKEIGMVFAFLGISAAVVIAWSRKRVEHKVNQL